MYTYTINWEDSKVKSMEELIFKAGLFYICKKETSPEIVTENKFRTDAKLNMIQKKVLSNFISFEESLEY